MYQGRIETKSGRTIDIDGLDATEIFLEMFVALEGEEPERILIRNV
jgi:endonuclease V-like protein UPF0215 family